MKFPDLDCKQYKLDNGLNVILSQDKELPLVSVNIWYKTGSANESGRKTGLAHFFEHMMFQGSTHVEKGMHFKYIQEAGGMLNGSTNFDRTNYYEKVPSEFLEMVLWLESDRMGFLLPALTEEKLQNQIDVIKNERLERYDNQPYGLVWEKILASLFLEKHPYSWPTIGHMEDILSYKMEDVEGFFKEYYKPSNASLVVAGNFEDEKARELIEKYFGNFEKAPVPPAAEYNSKAELEAIKEDSYEDNVQLERVCFAWPTDPAFGKDDHKLDILADILAGSKNGRLYKNLVFDKEIAQNVSAFQFSGKLSGFFSIIADIKPGVKSADVKKEIFGEIEKLTQSIEPAELERSKNLINSSFIFSLQNVDNIANQMNQYNFYLDKPDGFKDDILRYTTTDEKQLKDAAASYLQNNYVQLNVLPKKK